MDLPKILIPVDRTEVSANGLRYAIKLARIKNLELDIFHVLRDSDKNEIPHADIFRSEFENDLLYKEIIRKGEPAAEILQIASELEPELIIMCPDVFNKEKKFFEDSQTGKVIKGLHYPLFIIPPKTEFKGVSRIILGTDMGENIIDSIKGILKIFRTLNPCINILVFSDKRSTWHFKEDVINLLKSIKNYTGYNNISANICDHENICIGLDLYIKKTNADLICMESDMTLYHNLFFNCRISEIPSLLNKPILILPRHIEDIN